LQAGKVLERAGDSWLYTPSRTDPSKLLNGFTPLAFVVVTTCAVHLLSAGFKRADVVESVWHLDLSDARQRSAQWGPLRRSDAGCVLKQAIFQAQG